MPPPPLRVIHVVSVSSGKDSDATLLLALNRFGRERVRAVMCDTGNEHPLAWEHILGNGQVPRVAAAAWVLLAQDLMP